MKMNTWLRRVLYLAIVIPPLLALYWSFAWPAETPEPEDWRVSRGDPHSHFFWKNAGTFDAQPNFILYRLAYLCFLYFPGSDFGSFVFVGVLLVILACLGIRCLMNRLRNGEINSAPAHSQTMLFLIIVFWAFSPAFGADWLLAGRFGTFVPSVCFLGCACLLTKKASWRLRFTASLLLSQVALFTDKMGVLVWIAAAPLVLSEEIRQRATPRGFHFALWVLIGNLGTALSQHDFSVPKHHYPGIVEYFRLAAGRTLDHLVETAGGGMTPILPRWESGRVVVGALILLGFFLSVAVLIRRRHDRPLIHRATPWMSMGIFGGGYAFLSCNYYFGKEIPPAWIRELTWGSLLLPVAVIGLLGLLWPRRGRSVVPFLIPILFLLTFYDWYAGYDYLKLQRARLLQREALLVFDEKGSNIQPAYPPSPIPVQKVAANLRKFQRLRRAAPAPGMKVSDWNVSHLESGMVCGSLIRIDQDVAEGRVRITSHDRAPDLVLLSRRRGDGEHEIFKIAAPELQPDQESFIWSARVNDAEFFQPGDVVRAFGFDLIRRNLRPLAGKFRFTKRGFQSLETKRPSDESPDHRATHER